MFNRKIWKKFDFILFLTAILIFAIGLLFLYSATYQQTHGGSVNSAYGSVNSAYGSRILPQSFLLRQLIWFALALLVGILLVKIDYKVWLELAYPLYAINFVFLLLVLLLGDTRLGAQRWISFGNITFQPSEFSKLIIILTLARYLGQKETVLGRHLAISFLICMAPFALIVKQPDLGTALTLIPILFAVIYVWGASLRTLLLISAIALLSTPLLWQLLKDYQKRRILVFINPNIDPLGAGYTVIQSKIAIGSGRLFGKGWLAGTQNQLNFLPERHTDFIFSVVGEEWGFAGAMLLLILYFVLIWRAYCCGRHCLNSSGRLIICGIIAMLSFQVVINIAMTMGLVPVVGLPLPLISYGGSSLLTTMSSIFLLLNIGMRT